MAATAGNIPRKVGYRNIAGYDRNTYAINQAINIAVVIVYSYAANNTAMSNKNNHHKNPKK